MFSCTCHCCVYYTNDKIERHTYIYIYIYISCFSFKQYMSTIYGCFSQTKPPFILDFHGFSHGSFQILAYSDDIPIWIPMNHNFCWFIFPIFPYPRPCAPKTWLFRRSKSLIGPAWRWRLRQRRPSQRRWSWPWLVETVETKKKKPMEK